ncbi:Ino eighty subunit 2, partial [Tremellales sp. Uapishka_1]
MPAPSTHVIPNASRRARRVVDSSTDSSSPPPSGDEDAEGESEDVDLESEEDAAGSSDMDVDELEEDDSPPISAPSSSSALKIKFKLGGAVPAPSARPIKPLKKTGKKKKGGSEDDFSDDFSDMQSKGGSISPSKMTARQRAKQNKDLQDTLIELPNDAIGKKAMVLTEVEKAQKKEETARRRKRLTEQKQQDEQDQTINRLLRAQTGRSRAKLDAPSPTLESADPLLPTTPAVPVIPLNMIRTINECVNGVSVSRVAVPEGMEGWLMVNGDGSGHVKRKKDEGETKCAVEGCGEKRKYRSIKKFERGGCCIDHLRVVEGYAS